jgi:predicted nucleic acid-binding protein
METNWLKRATSIGMQFDKKDMPFLVLIFSQAVVKNRYLSS